MNVTTALHRFAWGLALVGSLPCVGTSQVRMSERGSVGQTVDGTTITVDYARPQARGRSPIFGQVVHWGETWTPGANWATTIMVSNDVKVNGEALAKGTYSLWMIPRQEEWTVFFHRTARLFHTQKPSVDSATVRLTLKPGQIDQTDVLTFAFSGIGRDRTTLELRWEKTAVPLVIEVPSSQPTFAADLAPAYTGAWTIFMQAGGGKADTLTLNIELKDGKLLGEVSKWGWTMELVPTRTKHSFLLGMVDKGEVIDVEADYPLVFTLEADRAVSFVVKSDTNDEWMRGIRAK